MDKSTAFLLHLMLIAIVNASAFLRMPSSGVLPAACILAPSTMVPVNCLLELIHITCKNHKPAPYAKLLGFTVAQQGLIKKIGTEYGLNTKNGHVADFAGLEHGYLSTFFAYKRSKLTGKTSLMLDCKDISNNVSQDWTVSFVI